jgi:hypothetical protein
VAKSPGESVRVVSAAHRTYTRNRDRLRLLLEGLRRETESTELELTRLEHRPGLRIAKRDIDKLKRHIRDSGRRLDLLLEITIVLFVTFCETYLQDVLARCAALDRTLMGDAGQSASYDEILGARSIPAITNELRQRWARNFVDDGGPARWVDRLVRMGGRGYHTRAVPAMEVLWGIRHIVVHHAGIVTRDFARRHPDFPASIGKRLVLNADEAGTCATVVNHFVNTTDAFLTARYPELGRRFGRKSSAK